jgi:hypothetical protein
MVLGSGRQLVKTSEAKFEPYVVKGARDEVVGITFFLSLPVKSAESLRFKRMKYEENN